MNKVFAFFGFIVLLILTLLTGGVGLILLLLKSESVRDFLAKSFADFVSHKIFEGPNWDYEEGEIREGVDNYFDTQTSND